LADTWNENLCNMNQAYISSSLIFIITITILTGEKLNNCSNSNICLPYYVIPVHYHIKLNHLFENYDLKNKYSIFDFYGKSSTIINILQSTQYIKLHRLNLIILGEITLIKNNGITYALNYIQTFKTLETNLLEFRFFNVLSPGLYTLKMQFFGHLTENSSKKYFKSFYSNKENDIV